MQRTDIPLLGERLNSLAEVYEKKPVTQKAMEVWFDVLREFKTENVCGMLIGWPKTHGKFPAPADVWKALNDAAINERERIERAERGRIEREVLNMGSTPQGREAIAAIKGILARPKRTPVEHWQHVLLDPRYSERSKQFAREALSALRHRIIEREPGQDDEEVSLAEQA